MNNGDAVHVRLLGTGTPMPDPARAASGTAIVSDADWVLIDCGRGVSQRVNEAGLDLSRLAAVFLTHHHTDHVSDLAALAILRWVDGAPDPMTVVAPAGPCARFASRCLDPFDDQAFFSQADVGAPRRPTINVETFAPADDPNVVFRDQSFVVSSAAVDHHPIEAAVGYRVDTAQGSIAMSGDTIVCPGITRLAAGAEVLIHEALVAELMSDEALEWNASAESVGQLARDARVHHLVLTHLLPAPRTPSDEHRFVDDARRGGYEGPISVARDHLIIEVPIGALMPS